MVWWGDVVLILALGAIGLKFWTGTATEEHRDEMADLLVLVKDREEGIEGTVRELCGWKWGDVVVVDDGSRDGTPAIAERLSRELPFCFVAACGRGGAVEEGLAKCSKPLVLLAKVGRREKEVCAAVRRFGDLGRGRTASSGDQ